MPVADHENGLHLSAGHSAEFCNAADGLVVYAHHDGVGKRALADPPQEHMRGAHGTGDPSRHPAARKAQICHRAVFVDDHAALFVETIARIRHFPAQKDGKFLFLDVVCLAAVIGRELLRIVRIFRTRSLNFDAIDEFEILRRGAHVHFVRAPFHLPCGGLDVVIAEGALVEGDLHLPALARL